MGDPLSCSEGLDCAGTCAGSASVDCAGTCNGDAEKDNSGNCTKISYLATIQPIFINNCTSICHNSTHSTGLDLRTYDGLMDGSNNFVNVIVAFDSTQGILLQYVKSFTMPPTGNLSPSQINRIATWIQEGALEN